jgi:hypothetical protein
MMLRLVPSPRAKFTARLEFEDLGPEAARQLGCAVRAVASGTLDRPALAIDAHPLPASPRRVRLRDGEVTLVRHPTGSHPALPHRLELRGLLEALARRGIEVRQAETRAAGRGSELAVRARLEPLDETPGPAPAPGAGSPPDTAEGYASTVLGGRPRQGVEYLGASSVRHAAEGERTIGLYLTIEQVREWAERLSRAVALADMARDLRDNPRRGVRSILMPIGEVNVTIHTDQGNRATFLARPEARRAGRDAGGPGREGGAGPAARADRSPGSGRDAILSISPDFDAPLPGFEEYGG